MNIDRNKISSLISAVDVFVRANHAEMMVEEDTMETYLASAIAFLNIAFSEDELAEAKREIAWKYQIRTSPGQYILADYELDNWYDDRKAEIDSKFWTRYRDYLIDTKHFSPSVVSTLGEDTLDRKLMNYILDPNAEYGQPMLRRGLIIGDVQSGKTSTYIGFMCKAADAGYKVFILLTGTIESLRKQTQERVEEGFIGINMSANSTGGERVGVGLDNQDIFAMSMTSRARDFTGDNDKIAVSLKGNKQAVVFVIKKNTTTLQKLTKWLVTLNADPISKKIDLPMLMIDDEADNASINTSSSKEDPTKINKLIRELASVFTKSNYVGFTATPFANVFIDPETTEKMETQDLFPEDFIVTLPTPEIYIGANQIFAADGKYHSQLTYITDAGREEYDGFSFWFKHKKDWAGELPESLTDAIYAFYIVNAIRDLRGDFNEHRSMLINISRFVAVQHYIKQCVDEIHQRAYRSIKYNIIGQEAMRDPVLQRIYCVWEKYYSFVEFSWKQIAEAMFKAVENIQIRVVNSSRSSERLEYPKNDGIRVIAIGGLALSRGLTLEGLVISYFYRNTCTYDVLMQMGRWFGYRKNYEDLFRIWTHKASADWYAEIAEATDHLKDDMSLMRELGQKPRDFGIRVRNNSAELQITAYNKMRNATDEWEYSSYFGGIVETPYLCYSAEVHKNNYQRVCQLIRECIASGYSFDRQTNAIAKGRLIIQNIPKARIIQLIRKLKISRFSSSFDTTQIAEFLENCDDKSIDVFDLAFMDGSSNSEDSVIQNVEGHSIYRVRRTCQIDRDTDRLNIGRRGKLAGTSDGLAGIIDFAGKTAAEIVSDAKQSFKHFYEQTKHIPFDENKSYPTDTWFKYVSDRKPLLMVYLINVEYDKDEPNQKKQIEELKTQLGDCPVVGFMLGLPKNETAASLTATRYKANRIYNWFERDELDVGVEE